MFNSLVNVSCREEHGSSVVLMDLRMPLINGIQATGWIRRRGLNTSVIEVTANIDAKERRRCMEIGMNDFLVKSARWADIQRVLERQIIQSQ